MGAPTEKEWNAMIQTFAICNLILFLLYYFSVFSSIDKTKRPPEDVAVGQYNNPDSLVPETAEAKERKLRYERHLNNVTENLPINVALFWGAFIIQNLCNMSGEGKKNTICLTVVIATYTGFRVLYTVCYLCKLQPWRSFMYLLALGSIMTAVINMVVAAFSTNVSNTFATA